jgi:CBS domain-containing protein
MNQIIETFVKKVVTAEPEDSLGSIARLMEQQNVGAVVIVENHRPVGILTDRDLALELGARGASPKTFAVRAMTSPVETIGHKENVFTATQLMKTSHVRRLPVVDDDGCLVGIVTLDDLLRVLGRELGNLIEGIKPEMEVGLWAEIAPGL